VLLIFRKRLKGRDNIKGISDPQCDRKGGSKFVDHGPGSIYFKLVGEAI
jgi:hypothetical protein